jgi:hypothetical protein
MDQETKEIISKQTGELDLVTIERIYFECSGDIGATICKIQNIEYQNKPKKPYSKFDEMREILDEKDLIFQNHLQTNKK